jgi:glycosyltransferase involved in cell wall biosynthesis
MRNEESCAAEAVAEALRIVSVLGLKYEIIVVNDHSCDGTAEVLGRISANNNKIKVVDNHEKAGLGAALRTGFICASGEVILYTDADLPCRMDELQAAISLMQEQGSDIVTAYKTRHDQCGLRRLVYSFVYNKIVNILFQVKLRDINFSFKLFRRDKLIKLNLKSEGSFINAELFTKARRAGYSILEFPVRYLPRVKGKSKLDNLGNIKKIICEMLIFITSKERL